MISVGVIFCRVWGSVRGNSRVRGVLVVGFKSKNEGILGFSSNKFPKVFSLVFQRRVI